MNIAWIIGNGFDLNLGLKTSYKEFYVNHYSKLDDEESVSIRKKLESIQDYIDPENAIWSDLELFLGNAAAYFDSFDEYDKTFLHLQKEMEKYLLTEDQRILELIRNDRQRLLPSIGRVEREFAESIYSLKDRIDAADAETIETIANDSYWNYKNSLVSLNYTNTLESIKNGFQEESLPLLYPHGRLDQRMQINFGVAFPRQINNLTIQRNSAYCDPWTKEGRNRLYGNRALEEAYSLFKKANLIVTFGVSFGETDSHLWKIISEEISKRDNIALLCFDFDLPEKSEGLYNYSVRAGELKKRLRSKLQLSDSDRNNERIIVCNSSRIFRFNQPFSSR